MTLPVVEKCLRRDWRMCLGRGVEIRLISARPDVGIGSTEGAIGRFGNDVYPVRVFYRKLGRIRRRGRVQFCVVLTYLNERDVHWLDEKPSNWIGAKSTEVFDTSP
jgi:hypothetical protein